MSHGFFLGAVEACAFENDVDTELAPRQVGRLRAGIDGDFLAVYRNGTGRDDGFAVLTENGILVGNGMSLCDIAALSRVVFEKVSEHFRACEVIDGDDFVALCAEHLTESQTSDTAEAVDGNFNRHFKFLRNHLFLSCGKIFPYISLF